MQARHCRRRCGLCGCAVARLVLLLVLAVAGGLLYRVRGGWGDWGPIDDVFGANVLTHDMFGRLFAWALPTALLLLALSRTICAGLVLAAVSVVLLYFGIMVGWGTYFTLGHEEWVAGSLGRVGAFDWLVGPRFPGANATTRFLRDFNGMTFRGLQQSVPTGFLLLLYGYGWLPLASGSVLGAVYEVGYYVTWDCLPADSNASAYVRDNFSGTAMAEFLTGFWTWLVCATALLAHRTAPDLGLHRLTRPGRALTGPSGSGGGGGGGGCGCALVALFHVGAVVFEAALAASCASYAMVQQSDMRNRNQSLLGLAVSLAGTVALHVACATTWARFAIKTTTAAAGAGGRATDGSDGGGSRISNAAARASLLGGRSNGFEAAGGGGGGRLGGAGRGGGAVDNGGAEGDGDGGPLERFNYGDRLNAPLLPRTLSEEFAPAAGAHLSDVLSPAFTQAGHEDDTFTATDPAFGGEGPGDPGVNPGRRHYYYRHRRGGCRCRRCCGLWCRCGSEAGKPPAVVEEARVEESTAWMGVHWTLERERGHDGFFSSSSSSNNNNNNNNNNGVTPRYGAGGGGGSGGGDSDSDYGDALAVEFGGGGGGGGSRGDRRSTGGKKKTRKKNGGVVAAALCCAVLRECCGGCPRRRVTVEQHGLDDTTVQELPATVSCTLTVVLTILKVISLLCLATFLGTAAYGATTCDHPFGNWSGASG